MEALVGLFISIIKNTLYPNTSHSGQPKKVTFLTILENRCFHYLKSYKELQNCLISVLYNMNFKNMKKGLEKNPNWIELTPDGKSAIVSNTSSNDVSIIYIEKWLVISTVPVGKNPKRLWVANTK